MRNVHGKDSIYALDASNDGPYYLVVKLFSDRKQLVKANRCPAIAKLPIAMAALLVRIGDRVSSSTYF